MSLSDLDGDGVADDYGTYDQSGQTDTLAPDSMVPPAGSSSFYLVTGKSFEEGTMGYASNGHERPNDNRCP